MNLAERAASLAGKLIASPADVLQWIRDTKQVLDFDGNVVATFIVDDAGGLRIADRHSEHVRCASGLPVQSAGEMTFTIKANDLSVTWVTNQSTGYCPEPESWPAVAAALEAKIDAPSGFGHEFVFRRCIMCESINVVKERFFECCLCSTALPLRWNLESTASAKPN